MELVFAFDKMYFARMSRRFLVVGFSLCLTRARAFSRNQPPSRNLEPERATFLDVSAPNLQA